ncbi:hypothetical protein G6F37_011287 [Rhizopus arrhizus]|nr:hypothetical protein G6F37_011287 [Rhizopus arrhizus]
MMTKYSTLLIFGLLYLFHSVFAQQAAVPAQVEITAEFPDNPFGMIVNGQRNKVLLDINNKDKTSYTVFAISGQVTKADDFSSVVRNLTATRYGNPLTAESSLQIPYHFYSEYLPGEHGLIVYVDLLSGESITRVVGYNGTITVTDPEGSWFDIQLLFLYAVLLAGAAGVAYVIREAFFGDVKRAKKIKKVEISTERPTHRDEKGEMVLDEAWIPEQHLGLNKQQKAKKRSENAGYETIQELKETNLIQLSKDLQLTKEEVATIITTTSKDAKLDKQSLAERIAQAEEQGISLSSKNLDKLLDVGIPAYRITEICGESGCGKTQVCMQLAVNTQLPIEKGGMDGECIYVDTEGSFLPSRLIEMAKMYDIESISKGVHLFRILDHIELIAFIRQLPTVLKEYPKVRLIVIDSIAYHFRLNTLDSKKRTHFVNYLAHTLVQIANKYKLAVVVTNHVTVNGIDGRWTPSLGASWGHWCTNRLYLYRKRQFRFGFLFKSTESSQSTPVQFCIKEEGITDPDENETQILKSEREAEIKNEMESTLEGLRSSAVTEEYERNMLDDDWVEPSTEESVVIKMEPIQHSDKHTDSVNPSSRTNDHPVESTEPTHQFTKVNTRSDSQQGKKRSRSDDESEEGYWSSDVEEDLYFLINMENTF